MVFTRTLITSDGTARVRTLHTGGSGKRGKDGRSSALGDRHEPLPGVPGCRCRWRCWSTRTGVPTPPPGAPSTISGLPSRNTIVGQNDVKQRLPGAMLPARPGRGSNTPMQPSYINPSQGVIAPAGMASECVSDTQLPSPSRTRRGVAAAAGAGRRRNRAGVGDGIGHGSRIHSPCQSITWASVRARWPGTLAAQLVRSALGFFLMPVPLSFSVTKSMKARARAVWFRRCE
ncbi:hypothetical protein D3C81_1284640 [compost metagenome]